ncbi:hypothetical protein Cme02nite_55760 [Catellatospora methionotrophica]|uniref:UvrD-like helicase ATP-binding domain-containing protein n=1 Tax=Catellatospora methionotrophica TaxID=121620 RepID=A0A8J3LKE6_9ACTN|nr:AAA domain-containing protein [Catellatospora methionotrophica]GIG17244.1 hypothetical protein Cme02nite_55760 [Catellatospora methionotrophica]
MRLRDLRTDSASAITLRTRGGENPATVARVGDEASLLYSSTGGNLLLRIGANAWQAAGDTPTDEQVLTDVIGTNLPVLAWVSRVAAPDSVAVQVHRFAHRLTWDQKLVIGVDDDAVRAVQRALHRSRTSADLVRWLADEFVLAPSADGRPVRVFGSAGQQSLDLSTGFVLHGRTTEAHLESRDGVLWLKTLRRPGRRGQREVALTLVEADLTFADGTHAHTFKQQHLDEFQRLLSSGQQYLNHWDEYGRMDQAQVIARAIGLGAVHYHAVHQQDARTYRFQLDSDDGQQFMSRLGDEHGRLAASTHAPDGLQNGTLDLDGRDMEENFTGDIAWVNPAANSLGLRVPEDRTLQHPPARGVLYLSLLGDRVRINRQRRARHRIETLSTPMPQLGLLLEGQPMPSARAGLRIVQPRSLKAFAPYQNFTDKQEEAVRIAINTPDIALIQGPPGTGKTRVITAIQDCLAEMAKAAGTIEHSVLLTSFQNDAVDEVVRRTKVFGLPAVKVSSRQPQGNSDAVAQWCREKAAQLRAERTPGGLLLQAARRAEALVLGYGQQPPTPAGTARLIAELDGLCGHYLSAALRSRLIMAGSALTNGAPVAVASADLEPLRRAVGGIRVDAVSFADDGPHMARRALLRLRAHTELAQHLNVIEQAAEWEGAEPPFLAELTAARDRLLDSLTTPAVPLNAVADEEIVALLSEVTAELRSRLVVSPDGVAAAVEAFLDDLENDPEAVGEAIRGFTAVVAATCQQSGSRLMSELVTGDDIRFDTVIVDEAARANPLDLMIPLCLAARRIVLVGDHRQLPHLLEPDIERDLEISTETEMLAALKQSMFERLFEYLRREDRGRAGLRREITLDTQFRMHPVLGRFVAEAFYASDTELGSGTNTVQLRHGIERYGDAVAVWADLPFATHGGETSGRSKSRRAEAEWIAAELKKLAAEAPPAAKVGVIAFYRAQVQLIWQALNDEKLAERDSHGRYRAVGALADRLYIGTVDAFQGREFDVVLLSATRSNTLASGSPTADRRKYGHLLLTNRLCVAMSRQQRLLITVGDAAMFREPSSTGPSELTKFLSLCEDGRYGRVVRR